jgi:hypothetical protein
VVAARIRELAFFPGAGVRCAGGLSATLIMIYASLWYTASCITQYVIRQLKGRALSSPSLGLYISPVCRPQRPVFYNSHVVRTNYDLWVGPGLELKSKTDTASKHADVLQFSLICVRVVVIPREFPFLGDQLTLHLPMCDGIVASVPCYPRKPTQRKRFDYSNQTPYRAHAHGALA